MAPPAVGAGTLRRLLQLHTQGPVLSVYLDLGAPSPRAHVRPDDLDALLAGLERQAGEANVRRLRDGARGVSALAHGARSLAMFSSAAGSVFEMVPLPSRVPSTAVLDTMPWLEPLASVFTPGNWGVAVLDRRTARLLRGGSRMLVEFATVPDAIRSRAALGDCSRHGLPPSSEEHHAEDARRLAALLMRAHGRRTFDQLAVVAPSEWWSLIEAALPTDLRGRLAGMVALELEHATPTQILAAVAPIMQQSRQDEAMRHPSSTITAPPGASQVAARQSATRLMQRLERSAAL